MQTQVQAEAWGPQAGEQVGCMFLMMVMGLRVLDRTVLCGRVHCAIIQVGLSWELKKELVGVKFEN